MLRLLPSALFCCLLISCGGDFDRLALMPTPTVFDQERKDFYTQKDYLKKSPYQGMLYATDRAKSEIGSNTRFYRNSRGSLLRVGLGTIDYSGQNLGDGLLRALPIAGKTLKPYPGLVTEVEEFGYLSKALPYGPLTDPTETKKLTKADHKFASLINQKLSVSDQREITIYVHGFKNVFENPLLASSELWSFLGNDGVFLAYAWPATPKLAAYFRDIETARLSGGNLRRLITYLSNNTNARRINIIAHSAGTRVTLTALNELALANPTKKVRLGQVAVIASDYDPQQFALALSEGILNTVDSLNIYLSRGDSALGISRRLFSIQRLGQVNDLSNVSEHVLSWFQKQPKVSFINVSNAPRSLAGRGHNYHRSSPWVSSDLLNLIRTGLPPEKRGLQRAEDGLTWEFPDNFPVRLQQLPKPR